MPSRPWKIYAYGLVVYAAVAGAFELPARAQTGSFEGKTIVRISYDPAHQPLDPRDLARVQLLHTGSALRSEDVAATLDRMFATGRYEDIQVDAEAAGAGVVLRFITRNAWFVGQVSARGKISNPPNTGQIQNAVQLDLGAPFRPEVLPGAEKAVRDLFTNNGLYEADVRLDTIRDIEHQQVNVEIIVNAGKRAKYETPVVHGETILSDETILKSTGWRIRFIHYWRHVTQTLTRSGIDRVARKYQKEDRLTAAVKLTSLDYDPETVRAQPTLNIEAGPKIVLRAVNAKVSKGRLKKYVPIYEEGAVDQSLLVEGARNLRDYFQSKGYPDVDVTFREMPPQKDQQTIEYLISRGPRRKLVAVRIEGNRYFDRSTIRDRMFLEPSSLALHWGRYSDAFRRRDEQAITDLYRANGFRDVAVSSRVVAGYRGKPNQIAVTFVISEGPQWLVARLKISGATYFKPAVLNAVVASGQGEPYSDVSIGLDRNQILNLYSSNGFPRASFEARATPASEPHQVELNYTIVEGNQEFVRDVLVSGLKVTRPEMVNRNLPIEAGQPLSSPAIQEAQRNLYDLGIFAEIDSAVQNSDGDDRYKYVLYNFDEAHRYTLNVGLGAEIAQLGATTSDLAAPTGGTGFTPRLTVDLNRLNVWGLGHTVSFQGRVSTLEQRAAVSYIDPRLFNDPNRTVTFSVLYDNARDIRTFASHREEGSVQLSQKFTRATTALFRFAYRRVTTSDVVIPALLVPTFLQPVHIGIVSTSLIQDRRDNALDPHRGMYNTLDVALATSALGSQRNFGKILGRNATYYPLTKNVVFARQLTVGAIIPYNTPAGLTAADAVPLPERFFGGGDISLRSFPENQAGPRDTGSPVGPGGMETEPTGFPLGGNAVLINNFELRFPLFGNNIGGVLFHDAGNIYRSFDDISFRFHQKNSQDFNYMTQAVGFGIRYKTPVGPLRIDLAYSINPPRFEGFSGTVQQLLACNPNLPPNQLPSQCTPVVQSISHFQYFISIGQTF
ncbi:MAG TPA: BamA/TamA family outer membrane protein [Bryobacteraceae bacterium]|nr:BamA/TamA family outer membrane protein [Bryobacteraceae bacterium]